MKAKLGRAGRVLELGRERPDRQRQLANRLGELAGRPLSGSQEPQDVTGEDARVADGKVDVPHTARVATQLGARRSPQRGRASRLAAGLERLFELADRAVEPAGRDESRRRPLPIPRVERRRELLEPSAKLTEDALCSTTDVK